MLCQGRHSPCHHHAFLPLTCFCLYFGYSEGKFYNLKYVGGGGNSCGKVLKNILYSAKVLWRSLGQEKGEEKVEEASLSPLGTGKTLSTSLSTWGQWHDLTLISKGPTGWWIGNTHGQSRHREPSLTPGRNNGLARWLQRRLPDELLASCCTLCLCVMPHHHLHENKTKLVLLSVILPKRPSGHREGAIQRHCRTFASEPAACVGMVWPCHLQRLMCCVVSLCYIKRCDGRQWGKLVSAEHRSHKTMA